MTNNEVEKLLDNILSSFNAKGYYLHVFELSAEDKALRKSPSVKCWYLHDGSSLELKQETEENIQALHKAAIVEQETVMSVYEAATDLLLAMDRTAFYDLGMKDKVPGAVSLTEDGFDDDDPIDGGDSAPLLAGYVRRLRAVLENKKAADIAAGGQVSGVVTPLSKGRA